MPDTSFVDFTYPGERRPTGVIERGVNRETIETIHAEAAAIRDSVDAFEDRRWDCRYVCAAWAPRLRSHGLAVHEVGGVGADEPAYDALRRFIPHDRRTGYLTDGGLILHFWMEIGPEGRIFDPVAHKFDRDGGVWLERYIVAGQPSTSYRLRPRSTTGGGSVG